MRITRQQKKIMDLVLKGDGAGAWLDIDQLITKLGAVVTKQATQCSLRFLENRNLITRTYATRRDRKRLVIEPTALAYTTLRASITS